MEWTEARQGVRMIKFLSILSRYEAAEFSQLEAAELLGVGERTFRRWRQRYEEDGEAGLLDRRLGKISGKRVPADREMEVEGALSRSLQRLHGEAFSRAPGARPPIRVGLHVDQDVPAVAGLVRAGAAAWSTSPQATAATAARHD